MSLPPRVLFAQPGRAPYARRRGAVLQDVRAAGARTGSRHIGLCTARRDVNFTGCRVAKVKGVTTRDGYRKLAAARPNRAGARPPVLRATGSVALVVRCDRILLGVHDQEQNGRNIRKAVNDG